MYLMSYGVQCIIFLQPGSSSFMMWLTSLLVGGDKGGADQRRFYKRLINVADDRYDEHLGTLAQQSKESRHAKKTR